MKSQHERNPKIFKNNRCVGFELFWVSWKIGRRQQFWRQSEVYEKKAGKLEHACVQIDNAEIGPHIYHAASSIAANRFWPFSLYVLVWSQFPQLWLHSRSQCCSYFLHFFFAKKKRHIRTKPKQAKTAYSPDFRTSTHKPVYVCTFVFCSQVWYTANFTLFSLKPCTGYAWCHYICIHVFEKVAGVLEVVFLE